MYLKKSNIWVNRLNKADCCECRWLLSNQLTAWRVYKRLTLSQIRGELLLPDSLARTSVFSYLWTQIETLALLGSGLAWNLHHWQLSWVSNLLTADLRTYQPPYSHEPVSSLVCVFIYILLILFLWRTLIPPSGLLSMTAEQSHSFLSQRQVFYLLEIPHISVTGLKCTFHPEGHCYIFKRWNDKLSSPGHNLNHPWTKSGFFLPCLLVLGYPTPAWGHMCECGSSVGQLVVVDMSSGPPIPEANLCALDLLEHHLDCTWF